MRRSLNPETQFLNPQAEYKYVDDLASVWCEAAELELGHKNFRRALELMRRATTPPARSAGRRSKEEMEGPVQVRAHVHPASSILTSACGAMTCPLHGPVGALYGWPDQSPRLPSSAFQGRLYCMVMLPSYHPGQTAPQPDTACVAV